MVEKKIKQIGRLKDSKRPNPSRGRVYDTSGISPTLTTCGGGGLEVKIVEKKAESINPIFNEGGQILIREATKKGYTEAKKGDSININFPSSKTRRGRVGKQIAHTLTTQCEQAVVLPCIAASRGKNPDDPSCREKGQKLQQRLEINTRGISNTLTTVTKDNYVIEEGLAVRKLTPREYARLQNFSDDTFDKLTGISNSQLYKIFGNSITVAVPREAFILQALICIPAFTKDHSCVNCENCIHAGGNKFYCDVKYKLIAEKGRQTANYEENCKDWQLKEKIKEVLATAKAKDKKE